MANCKRPHPILAGLGSFKVLVIKFLFWCFLMKFLVFFQHLVAPQQAQTHVFKKHEC